MAPLNLSLFFFVVFFTAKKKNKDSPSLKKSPVHLGRSDLHHTTRFINKKRMWFSSYISICNEVPKVGH